MTEFIEGAPCRACSKTMRYVSPGRCVACTRRHIKRQNSGVRAKKWSSDKARIQELEAEVAQLRAMIGASVVDFQISAGPKVGELLVCL